MVSGQKLTFHVGEIGTEDLPLISSGDYRQA